MMFIMQQSFPHLDNNAVSWNTCTHGIIVEVFLPVESPTTTYKMYKWPGMQHFLCWEVHTCWLQTRTNWRWSIAQFDKRASLTLKLQFQF